MSPLLFLFAGQAGRRSSGSHVPATLNGSSRVDRRAASDGSARGPCGPGAHRSGAPAPRRVAGPHRGRQRPSSGGHRPRRLLRWPFH